MKAWCLRKLDCCRRSTWLCLDQNGLRTSLHSDKRGIIQVCIYFCVVYVWLFGWVHALKSYDSKQ